MKINSLYYGDCLDWMRQWPADSVDLVYLDPPFNSNANYNVLFKEQSGEASPAHRVLRPEGLQTTMPDTV